MSPHPVSPENNVVISVLQHNIFGQPPLPGLREIADSFHVADNAGQIIHVLAMTFRTLFQVSLSMWLHSLQTVLGILKVK